MDFSRLVAMEDIITRKYLNIWTNTPRFVLLWEIFTINYISNPLALTLSSRDRLVLILNDLIITKFNPGISG